MITHPLVTRRHRAGAEARRAAELPGPQAAARVRRRDEPAARGDLLAAPVRARGRRGAEGGSAADDRRGGRAAGGRTHSPSTRIPPSGTASCSPRRCCSTICSRCRISPIPRRSGAGTTWCARPSRPGTSRSRASCPSCATPMRCCGATSKRGCGAKPIPWCARRSRPGWRSKRGSPSRPCPRSCSPCSTRSGRTTSTISISCKAGIHYRGWGQKDPLIEYKQDAFEMFEDLIDDMRSTFTERWLKVQIQVGPPPRPGGPTAPAGGRRGTCSAAPRPRRPTPMVATKPAADGLVSGEHGHAVRCRRSGTPTPVRGGGGRTRTPASDATIPVRAAAARSSRSATARRCERRRAKGVARVSLIPRAAPPAACTLNRMAACRFRPTPRRCGTAPRERLWRLGTSRAHRRRSSSPSCSGPGAPAAAPSRSPAALLARATARSRRLASRPAAERRAGSRRGARQGGAVAAALELGRRLGARETPPPERIAGPADVHRRCAPRLRDLAVEEFHVLALGSQSQVLARPPDHARDSQQLPGAPARGVSGGDRRSGGGDHPGAQPPERRPDALGGRPGGDAPARGGRATAGHSGARPRDHRRRAIHELRGGRPAVTRRFAILQRDDGRILLTVPGPGAGQGAWRRCASASTRTC